MRLQDLVAVDVRDRHLCGGIQEQVVLADVVHVRFQLGQLPGAVQRGAPDDVRRRHLGVAVVAHVEVEHERDQRPLQPRAHAGEQQEARARDLRRPLEVQQAERRGQVPVRLRGEVELADRAPGADDLVLRRVRSRRHRRVRQVGDPRGDVRGLLLELAQLVVQLLHAVAQFAHGRNRASGVLAGFLELRDVLARGIALGLELFGLVQQRQSAFLDLVETRQVQRGALERDAGFDLVAVLAKELEIVHGIPVGGRGRARGGTGRGTGARVNAMPGADARPPGLALAFDGTRPRTRPHRRRAAQLRAAISPASVPTPRPSARCAK
jgi:hypothetical protein